MGLSLGRAPLHSNFGQVIYTYVPLVSKQTTTQCSSPVLPVLQYKLVSWLRATKTDISTTQWAMWLEKDLTFYTKLKATTETSPLYSMTIQTTEV